MKSQNVYPKRLTTEHGRDVSSTPCTSTSTQGTSTSTSTHSASTSTSTSTK